MRESEHFNLFLAEGSDIVNPLVQDVNNYEKIDEQMFDNQNAGVQNATELKNGTIHAITRNVPDAQFITFTATSNYTAGETFTVDGVQVSALTVGGEALPTGAYVINSQVLCVLKGTLLTFYGIGSEEADNALALNGHPDTYFGTKEEVTNAIETANASNTIANTANTLANTVNESVNELNINLEKHTVVIGESIKSNVSAEFIAPSDGYIKVTCHTQAGATAELYINHILVERLYNYSQITSNNTTTRLQHSVFVRKGSIISIGGTNAFGTFLPLE